MHSPDHIALHVGAATLFLLTLSIALPSAVLPAEKISPAAMAEIVTNQAGQLAAVDSNAGALSLFTTTVGPSLGLHDVAGTLAAKGLPPKLAKELGVAELSQTVHQLMALLAVWQLADVIRQTDQDQRASVSSPLPLPSPARQEWMSSGSQISALADLFRLLTEPLPSDPLQPAAKAGRSELRLAAHRVAFEAHQQAIAAWWELYGWKDRVRQTRGQARLCGTWQWVIHNHQNHGEQKTVMFFPPAGQKPANVPLPTEAIILGDSIYLRWEHAGHIQEDSLLFTRDGARIEGYFVNNTGGWGSITGKRTAGCQP